MEHALNVFVTLAFFAPVALMVAANLAAFRAPAVAAPVLPRMASLLPTGEGQASSEAANDAEFQQAA